MSTLYHHKILHRTAVVIADSSGEPFDEIRTALHPRIWEELQSLGVDLYYVSGVQPSRFEWILNRMSDKLRYTKIWPIQYILDRVLLKKYNSNLPEIMATRIGYEIRIPEGLRFLGVKMFTTYLKLFDLGYEIVFKTTMSSIVNTEKFIDFVNGSSQTEAIYAGREIISGEQSFISGANTFLNRLALERVGSRIEDWDNGSLDDVALGKILFDVPRINIGSLNLDSISNLEETTDFELMENLHFRCKSSDKPRRDVEIMETLLVRLTNAKNR